jgi:hypothetical protein
MKNAILASACLALGLSAHANTITFTFLENGLGTLGTSSTFIEQGVALTAYASPGQMLFAKNDGADEVGLGLVPQVHGEITSGTFIQLALATSPASQLQSISLNSVQPGESGSVWLSPTLGVLGAPIAVLTSNAPFAIPAGWSGYIGISSPTGDVLIDSVSANFASVPDNGMTLAFLGTALVFLGAARRKLPA